MVRVPHYDLGGYQSWNQQTGAYYSETRVPICHITIRFITFQVPFSSSMALYKNSLYESTKHLFIHPFIHHSNHLGIHPSIYPSAQASN